METAANDLQASSREQGRRDVVFVGRRGTVAKRLGETLKGRSFRLLFHATPADSPPAGARSVAPVLYVVSFLASPPGRASRGRKRANWADQYLHFVRDVTLREPGVPVLIAADEATQRHLIQSALKLGAKEVISENVARISVLFAARVDAVLPNFRGASAWAPTRTSTPRQTPDVSRSEQGEDWVEGEEWEGTVPQGEVAQALTRVRTRASSLPTRAQRNRPLAGVLDIATPKLRGPSGRLDAQRLADRLGVSLRQLAAVAGVTHQALSATPDSKRAQPGLDAIARALGTLDTLLAESSARAWLNAPHSMLNGATPLQALLDGRAERVASMLGVAVEGGVA